MMRVLLIEENRRLSQAFKMGLLHEGYAVDTVYDGCEGHELARTANYDVLILEMMLPGKSGLEICWELRRQGVNTPILLLTEPNAVVERVHRRDNVADAYLMKPFALSELLVRLRALLQRDHDQQSDVLRAGDLSVDLVSHTVERAGQRIEMTAQLFTLLEFFMRHLNQVLTREMIASYIWDYEFTVTSNAVEVYVRRLRKLIDDPFPVKLIETVRGIGYRLRSVEHV